MDHAAHLSVKRFSYKYMGQHVYKSLPLHIIDQVYLQISVLWIKQNQM
jgi:hypothetical protein